MKILGQGLQYTVFQYSDTQVIKKPNSDEEMIAKLQSWRPLNEKQLNLRISHAKRQRIDCFSLIQTYNIPLSLFGNPVFLDDSEYIQDLLMIPQYMNQSEDQIIQTTKDYIDLLQTLWSYGLHDIPMYYLINCGYNRLGKLVIADFSEFTQDIRLARSGIGLRRWHRAHFTEILAEPLKAKVISLFDKSLTFDSLNHHWNRLALKD